MSKWLPIALLGVGVAVVVVGGQLLPTFAQDKDQDAAGEAEPKREVDKELISDPSHEKMKLTAPDKYEVKIHTTAGDFIIEVDRELAPIGADRFYSLVKNGFYDGTVFFRVVEDFVVQWGIHGDPEVNLAWYDPANKGAVNLKDDPVKTTNAPGTIVFANAGPNTRSTQLFINFGNNRRLDAMGFAPFGKVKDKGMDVVEKLYDDYEMFDPRFDRDPSKKVSQGHLARLGNEYIKENFPKLDSIITATVVEAEEAEEAEAADE